MTRDTAATLTRPSLALYAPSGAFQSVQNPFGKDTANLGLFRALALHGDFAELGILAQVELSRDNVVASLCQGQASTTQFWTGSILRPSAALRAGTVLRGKADLADLAWGRETADPRGYSLIGLIHTIAPPGIRDQIAAAAIAPVQPWDALICTSPSVQAAVGQMFDAYGEYLGRRFSSSVRPRPHLPLIPLGVDAARMAALADRPDVRQQTRAALGLAEDDALVFWLGRLSFFEKAFPQPMFRALAEAQALSGRPVHFAMAGWFPDGEEGRARYEEAAHAYAPDVVLHLIDGNDSAQVGALWAAADIFLSLVDNIQETFGLTPLEAMAAGLPVVASHWDGYAYTIRDTIDGFLIRTLGGPPGLGQLMNTRHVFGMDSYQTYVGNVAQHTAVDIGMAAQALARLLNDPDLRRRMGEAGRRRMQTTFDWAIVAKQVRDLVIDLDGFRRSAGAFGTGSERRTGNPVKGDPFVDFAGFAAGTLTETTRLRLRTSEGLSRIADELRRMKAVRLDAFGAAWRGSPDEWQPLLRLLLGGPQSVATLLSHMPEDRRPFASLALMWMCKLGLLDWSDA